MEAHWTALDLRETGLVHERNYLSQVEIRMRVEPPYETSTLFGGSAEVDRQKTASRLQNPANLANAQDAHVMRQMMQHHGAQDDVEGSILRGKSLRGGRLEIHLDAVLPGLLFRTADHLRRGIDSCGLAEVPDAILCRNGQCSSAASHI